MYNVKEMFGMECGLAGGTFVRLCLFQSPVFIITGYSINMGYYYFDDL